VHFETGKKKGEKHYLFDFEIGLDLRSCPAEFVGKGRDAKLALAVVAQAANIHLLIEPASNVVDDGALACSSNAFEIGDDLPAKHNGT